MPNIPGGFVRPWGAYYRWIVVGSWVGGFDWVVFGGSFGWYLYHSILRPFSLGDPYCFVAVSLFWSISVNFASSIAFAFSVYVGVCVAFYGFLKGELIPSTFVNLLRLPCGDPCCASGYIITCGISLCTF